MNKQFEEQLKVACLDGQWHLALDVAERADVKEARRHGFVTALRRRPGYGYSLWVKRLSHHRKQDRELAHQRAADRLAVIHEHAVNNHHAA